MPPLPRIARGPVDFGRRASPQDFGAGVAQERAQTGQIVSQVGGVVAEHTDRILQARKRAELALAAAQFQAGQSQALFDSEADQDLDTLEERFGKRVKDLADQAKKSVDPQLHADLDERIFAAREHGMLELRRNIRNRNIGDARARTQEMLKIQSGEAARARDLVRFNQIRGQVHGQLDEQLDAGIIDRAQYDQAVRGFDESVTDARVLAGLNEDPAGTLQALRARAGVFANMNEEKRQAGIAAAENEVRQREQIAKAEAREVEARAEKAKQAQLEEAVQHGLFAEADGALSVDWVKENRARLDPQWTRYFLDAAAKAEATVGDPREIFRLEAMQYTNPKAFAAEKLDPAKLGPKKAIELLKAQSEIKKGEIAPTGATFRTRLIERLKEQKGIDDGERAELYRIGEASLQKFAEQKGGRPTPVEEQSVIDETLLRRTVRERGGFLFLGTNTAITPEGTPLEIPDVPPQHVDQIIESLKKRGMPVTAASIRDTYLKAKAAGAVK